MKTHGKQALISLIRYSSWASGFSLFLFILKSSQELLISFQVFFFSSLWSTQKYLNIFSDLFDKLKAFQWGLLVFLRRKNFNEKFYWIKLKFVVGIILLFVCCYLAWFSSIVVKRKILYEHRTQ